jgi:hypothetical protein
MLSTMMIYLIRTGNGSIPIWKLRDGKIVSRKGKINE